MAKNERQGYKMETEFAKRVLKVAAVFYLFRGLGKKIQPAGLNPWQEQGWARCKGQAKSAILGQPGIQVGLGTEIQQGIGQPLQLRAR